MIDHLRLAVIAILTIALHASPLAAQTPFQYRQFVLESSVATLVETAGPRGNDPRTLHVRPALIQEVVWRAPYMGLAVGSADPAALADPALTTTFAFYNDQLYQILVTYDRSRMAGLTDQDVVGALSATYGTALLRGVRTAPNLLPADIGVGVVMVAQWEDSRSLLTLLRSTYAPQYQLALVSKRLDPLARAAIAEGRRLDALEAPQRDLERRAEAAAAAALADRKTREANRTAFRP